MVAETREALNAFITSFGYGGEDAGYQPSEFLRCPFRGPVLWAQIPYDRARELVVEANDGRSRRRQLEEPSPVSEAEIVMLAALLFYGEKPTLQHPVGPYDLDFLIDDYGAAIEVDGLGYHDRERDRRRDNRVFQISNIRTYRVAAKDVFKDPLWAVRGVCRNIISDVRLGRQGNTCHTF